MRLIKMSEKAEAYKKNSNEDFEKMTINELNKLPSLTGIFEYQLKNDSFNMLCVNNDDSSIVKTFWKKKIHEINALEFWYKISKKNGIFIDIGSHTGLYTLCAKKANLDNIVIFIEPQYDNVLRTTTNLRLNNLLSGTEFINAACSDYEGRGNFTDFSSVRKGYHYQGGKLEKEGRVVQVIKLDGIRLDSINKKVRGIKIDCEGEELKILKGGKKIIKSNYPDLIIEIRENNKLEIQEFLIDLGYSIYLETNLDEKINLSTYNNFEVRNIIATKED